MPAPAIDWTEERVEQLKSDWAAGKSASLIGADLGISRSAVIGKATRLKLPVRETTTGYPSGRHGHTNYGPAKERAEVDYSLRRQRPPRKPRTQTQAATERHVSRRLNRPQDKGGGPVQRIQSRVALPPSHMTDLPPDQSPDAVPFLARVGATCRWPLNDVVPIALHMSCGSPTEGECSYCARHFRLSCAAPRRPQDAKHGQSYPYTWR
jgi:GcrA cell cycle regulator